MMAAIAEAETAALIKAKSALNEALLEKAQQARALDEKWAPVLNGLRTKINAADAALKDALTNATPLHPLHGRKVFRMEKEVDRWSRRVISEHKICGILETSLPRTEYGRGYWNGSNTAIGDPFVRLLKKDGTPGKASESYPGSSDRWQLEPETASHTEARGG